VARKIAITVHPSGVVADSLTVADAMRQVLDIIETLDRIDDASGDTAGIVWRLDSATSNSPFTIVASAVSPDPAISVTLEANRVTETFAASFEGLLQDERVTADLSDGATTVIERVLKRNLNGIGRTDISFPDTDAPPIYIVPTLAERGLRAIERHNLDEAEANPTLARSEFGAREGELAGVTKYHNAPALIVRDRITGDRFTAVLKPELAKRLGPLHSWGEAWEGRRIVVTGTLHFDAAGIVRRADAEDLEPVTPAVVTLADLEGIDLLGGKSVGQHLALIWERNG
jgi:hypothetical protein